MAKVDWLRREVEAAEAEVKRWPAWMRSDTANKEKSSSKVVVPRPAKEARKSR
jgi:hypothetical protein